MSEPKQVTLQELPELRRKTEAVAKLLQEQLTRHVDTLRPLFSADRVFGKYAGGKGEDGAVERAYNELQQGYREFTRKPFDLPQTFEAHWLTLVGTRLALYPWEYVHEAKTDRESKSITMTAPLQWVLCYASNYTLSQMRQAITGKETPRPEYVRQFVVNAFVLQQIINKNAGIVALLGDLRYEVKTATSPDLKTLPLVTIRSAIPSFCPADDLILAATAFSGVPAFIELIDVHGIQNVKDPLTARIEEFIK
jgi:hypothetical protein